jgi:hypothetical protein
MNSMGVFRFLGGKISNVVDWLVDRSTAVYSICITSLVFMGLIFLNNISYETKMIKILDDNINLNADVQNYRSLTGSQQSYIEIANGVMLKQKNNLVGAEKFIQMQSDVIKKLIERLEYLSPKTPIDPDKWTEDIKDRA